MPSNARIEPPSIAPSPRFDWRPWPAYVGRPSAAALLARLLLGILVLVFGTQTLAQVAPDPAIGRLADVGSPGQADRATLLFRTTQGFKAAPLLATDVHIDVTGPVVRTTVVQTFDNPGQDWLEGVYAFPLPDDSAVDRLRMHIGERIIEGRVREREAARAEYRDAAAAGQQASLVEQQRPNLFTARVANIAPSARIAIRIEYQQALAMVDGAWRLRLPTVVAPRYDPQGDILGPGPLPVRLPTATGDSSGQQDDTPDGSDDLSIRVRIDAGVPVTPPTSTTHAIRVSREADHLYEVELARAAIPDRDFELVWMPVPGEHPAGAFRLEPHGELHYGQLVLAPPSGSQAVAPRVARETTFVIDTSGSMAGASFEQAVRALRLGLAELQPGDHFNLIRFSDRHESLYPAPQPFDATRRREALEWIDRLRAQGGTEMRGAIEQALGAPVAPGMVSQVVFMTDGAVGYEADMLALIERKLGARRFFTVGIGSAPNGWFMRKAAAAGRGSFTYIHRVEDVETRMTELYARLARPMLTDLRLRFEGAQPLEPVDLPGELYSGEPIVVRARFASAPTAAVVSGSIGAIRWESRVAASDTESSGLHAAWARQRIEELGDEIARTGGDRGGDGTRIEMLRTKVRDLGLAHHLVTAYTSLVAVDVTPARPADAPMQSTAVPTRLPAGWEADAVFGTGELARGATPAMMNLAMGLALLALAGMLALVPSRRTRFR